MVRYSSSIIFIASIEYNEDRSYFELINNSNNKRKSFMPLLNSKAEKFAKKAEDYPSIFGSVNLTSIRENVGQILKLIGRDGIFREYTLHDETHIDAMLALVDKLIPADTAKK